MKTIISRIEEKLAEAAQLLQVLRLWASVAEQGINIGSVVSFGFDQRIVTLTQRSAIFKAMRQGKPDPITGKHERHNGKNLYIGTPLPIFNYVKLKDGSKVTLNQLLKAP